MYSGLAFLIGGLAAGAALGGMVGALIGTIAGITAWVTLINSSSYGCEGKEADAPITSTSPHSYQNNHSGPSHSQKMASDYAAIRMNTYTGNKIWNANNPTAIPKPTF